MRWEIFVKEKVNSFLILRMCKCWKEMEWFHWDCWQIRDTHRDTQSRRNRKINCDTEHRIPAVAPCFILPCSFLSHISLQALQMDNKGMKCMRKKLFQRRVKNKFHSKCSSFRNPISLICCVCFPCGVKRKSSVCGSPLVYTLMCLNKSSEKDKTEEGKIFCDKKESYIKQNEQRNGWELIQRFHFTFMSTVYVAIGFFHFGNGPVFTFFSFI